MTDIEYIPSLPSNTANYSSSSIGMVDSTGVQMASPIDTSTGMDIARFLPIIYRPTWDFGEKQNKKSSFSFDWAGGLSDLKDKINSVELAHETLKWR